MKISQTNSKLCTILSCYTRQYGILPKVFRTSWKISCLEPHGKTSYLHTTSWKIGNFKNWLHLHNIHCKENLLKIKCCICFKKIGQNMLRYIVDEKENDIDVEILRHPSYNCNLNAIHDFQERCCRKVYIIRTSKSYAPKLA